VHTLRHLSQMQTDVEEGCAREAQAQARMLADAARCGHEAAQ
jgi:hypothetical protein